MYRDSGMQEIKRKYNNLITTKSPSYVHAIIMATGIPYQYSEIYV